MILIVLASLVILLFSILNTAKQASSTAKIKNPRGW